MDDFDNIKNVIHQKLRFLFVMLFCVAVVACTSKIAEEKEFSGFLSDYSQLKSTKSFEEEGAPVLLWVSPVLPERSYTKVMIDPVVLYPAPQPGPQIRSEVLTGIQVYLDKAVREEVGKKYEIVDERGKDVVRVRAAITGVKTSVEDLAAYEYIPIALVLAGASTAAGTRDELVEIFLEAEMIDSLSGEKLAAGIRKGLGEPVESDEAQVELENVRPVLDTWAKSVVNFLDATIK
ncbi:DUF3313 domain-containing protein [Photobacterium sagamiensis]|uniref:DUF3313 domain-containing protein n=1 Tax=Photobacterium sagamiensis TaxID=2910241 RepID=UPI003D0E2656